MSTWYMGVMFISLKSSYKTQEQFGAMRKPQIEGWGDLRNKQSC